MSNVERFKLFLEEKNLYMEEFNPESGVTFFRVEQSLENGGDITLLIAFNDMFVEAFATNYIKVDNPLRKERILELINDLNTEFRFVKFYLAENSINVQSTNFNGEVFSPVDAFECLIAVLRAADEAYPKFMRALWG
ncbi:hypothetical protein D1953_00210 [Peribacillus asahii]|uniref:YbjN domain-containing protein n=1 Tax=Peribacillus asahii TaxID=228899 RepID=A0A398BNW4_9BACI|nr:YbjN domain-containing protein [Peribacillus asahii]RID89036.1 hypothetical protein D1953_00210 [Peribacillus asahii]